MSEKFVFKFELFPSLLGLYQKYRTLELAATKYSMTESARLLKKYEKATRERDAYGYNILAKEIFQTFNTIKPQLHKRRGEGGYYSWDEVFGDMYETLDEKQKKCLIGLLYRQFVYELPSEYYND